MSKEKLEKFWTQDYNLNEYKNSYQLRLIHLKYKLHKKSLISFINKKFYITNYSRILVIKERK